MTTTQGRDPNDRSSSSNGDGIHSSSSTYAGQSSLPRLPIPKLEDTLDRFPAAVSALLSSSSNGGDTTDNNDSKEMKECLEEIEKFRTTDGPVLQKLLVEYDQRGEEEDNVGSYVEEFWTDAYLAPDSSVGGCFMIILYFQSNCNVHSNSFCV